MKHFLTLVLVAFVGGAVGGALMPLGRDAFAQARPPASGGSSGGAATTAQTLATPRAINGVSFDGSADITVPSVRSALGAGASDVVTRAGSTVANGSVDANATLFSVRAGIGGSEVETFKVIKGGIFYGASSAAVLQLNDTVGARLNYGSGAITVTGSAITATVASSFTAASGDAITAASGGYIRADKAFAGAPTAGDCDAAGEQGRIAIDTTNNRFYWCQGAAGWKYAVGL